MATRAVKQRRRSRAQERAKGIPLPDMYGLQWPAPPRCECGHGEAACPDPATHRVSVLCAAEGCATAVHVYLVCAGCVDNWLWHARTWHTRDKLRVTPL